MFSKVKIITFFWTLYVLCINWMLHTGFYSLVYAWIYFSFGNWGTMCHLFEESAKVDICLLISPKNTNLVEDFEILIPVKFCWIPISGFRGKVENLLANQRPGRPSCFSELTEKHKLGRGRWDLASCQVSFNSVQQVENVSAYQRPGRPSCFSDRPEKHKLGRGLWDLASCQVSLNSVPRFQRRSRKCLSQSEARAAILFFRSALKNTDLVEDVEILLPVEFRCILYSSFRGEVENVSANQRPGRPSCFPDRPKKHKLGRGRWDLASY